MYETDCVASAMTMTRIACVAALISAAIAASGCGADPAEPATGATRAATTPQAAKPAPVPAVDPKPDDVLPVARRGHPVLWVRKGETALLRSSPGGERLQRVGDRTEFGSPTVFSVDHTQGPWAAVPTPLQPNGRLAWVKLDPRHLGSGFTDLSVSVDVSDRVAEFRRGSKVVDRFPVTVGAPGVDTPTGRFAVTDTFRGNLNDASYGCCAVALTAHQPHLPSGWLGGSRIAIHGTYGPLGQALSHGCIRAANEDVGLLVDKISLGTPVTITP
jgi:hypothetical protein